MNTTLVIPGYRGSGPDHWQSLWELKCDNFIRVQQRDWEHPICAEWVENLENAVTHNKGDLILVAHSLGCLLVAHWAAKTQSSIKGALLVAPPNPDQADFPTSIIGFSPLPQKQLNFASIVVASSNDPYGDLDFAKSCATTWDSHFSYAGAIGHINADSGLGQWDEGFKLYQSLAYNQSY